MYHHQIITLEENSNQTTWRFKTKPFLEKDKVMCSFFLFRQHSQTTQTHIDNKTTTAMMAKNPFASGLGKVSGKILVSSYSFVVFYVFNRPFFP